MPTREFTFEPLTGPEWTKTTNAMRKEVWHRVEGPGLEIDVAIRLGVGEDGRLGCTGVLVGAGDTREVTARGLRTIPLGQIMTAVASYLAGGDSDDPLTRAVQKHYAESILKNLAGVMENVRRQRPGPAGWDDQHYERVVAVYRDALVRAPRAPIVHAAKQLQASESTVRRWLKTARDRGIAGASISGKAGERRPAIKMATRKKGGKRG